MNRHANAIFLSLLPILSSGTASQAHPGHDEGAAPPDSMSRALSPFVASMTLLADNSLPPATVSIEVRDGFRHIAGNGLPNHATGKFPGRGNPNPISAQKYAFKVPVDPKPADKAATTQPANPQPGGRPPGPGPLFGVAINGVVFDPGTAEYWRDDRALGWRMEAIGGPRNLGLDLSNAHVQPNGAYHYHGVPLSLIEQIAGDKNAKKMVLVGWAADGYPIYGPYGYSKADDASSELRLLKPSYRLKQQDRPGGNEGPGGKPDGAYTRDWEYAAGTGDLDEFNGRTGVTPEFPKGTYYYVLTDAFPFIPRQHKGTPDASFIRRGPPNGGPPGRPNTGGRRPPPER
jgi:hypothetical protein